MKKIALVVIAIILMLGVGFQIRKSMKSGSGGLTKNGQTSVAPNGSSPSGDGTHASSGKAGSGSNTEGTSSNGAGSESENGGNPTSENGVTSPSGNSVSGNTQGGTPGTTTPSINPATGLPNPPGTVAAVDNTPKETCFSAEYHHKKEMKSRDIEEFLDFTNAFPVAANYNPDTMCVKVNQKPENFTLIKTKRGTEVRVGSVVGPDSVIKVSYCIGKVTCKEDCTVPKKRFMDDMMSDASDDDSFSDSWGKDDTRKKDLKSKAKELRAVASESQSLNEGSVVRDWDTLQKQEWVCKESQKRKEK